MCNTTINGLFISIKRTKKKLTPEKIEEIKTDLSHILSKCDFTYFGTEVATEFLYKAVYILHHCKLFNHEQIYSSLCNSSFVKAFSRDPGKLNALNLSNTILAYTKLACYSNSIFEENVKSFITAFIKQAKNKIPEFNAQGLAAIIQSYQKLIDKFNLECDLEFVEKWEKQVEKNEFDSHWLAIIFPAYAKLSAKNGFCNQEFVTKCTEKIVNQDKNKFNDIDLIDLIKAYNNLSKTGYINPDFEKYIKPIAKEQAKSDEISSNDIEEYGEYKLFSGTQIFAEFNFSALNIDHN